MARLIATPAGYHQITTTSANKIFGVPIVESESELVRVAPQGVTLPST